MVNYKTVLDEIQTLVNDGHNILEIEINGESSFFFTNDFEPPSIGSVATSPYLTFSGIDITIFMTNTDYNLQNKALFIERFMHTIKDGLSMDYKMSDSHTWRYYS